MTGSQTHTCMLTHRAQVPLYPQRGADDKPVPSQVFSSSWKKGKQEEQYPWFRLRSPKLGLYESNLLSRQAPNLLQESRILHTVLLCPVALFPETTNPTNKSPLFEGLSPLHGGTTKCNLLRDAFWVMVIADVAVCSTVEGTNIKILQVLLNRLQEMLIWEECIWSFSYDMVHSGTGMAEGWSLWTLSLFYLFFLSIVVSSRSTGKHYMQHLL